MRTAALGILVHAHPARRFAGVLLLVAAGVSVATAASEPWGTCTSATAPGTGVHTVTQFGSTRDDEVRGVAVGGTTGAVAVGGFTEGTLPGQQSAGYQDAFVALYSRSGTLLWRQQFTSMIFMNGVSGCCLPWP